MGKYQPLPVVHRPQAGALLSLHQCLLHDGGVHEAEPDGAGVYHVRVQPVGQRGRLVAGPVGPGLDGDAIDLKIDQKLHF